jgi:hypothetical protein
LFVQDIYSQYKRAEVQQGVVIDDTNSQENIEHKEAWNVVATCYFIDCANNILGNIIKMNI